jgi:hypothetical protein
MFGKMKNELIPRRVSHLLDSVTTAVVLSQQLEKDYRVRLHMATPG